MKNEQLNMIQIIKFWNDKRIKNTYNTFINYVYGVKTMKIIYF